MIKIIEGIVIFCVCLVIALIPEIIMYNVWSALSPVTVLEKVLTFGLFWFVGAGACVVFGLAGAALWFATLD